MTKEQLEKIGFSNMNPIMLESGLEWLADNTELEICLDNILETIEQLPASAKVFLMKFATIMERNPIVISESIDSISQTYSNENITTQIFHLAKQLIGNYLKSNTTFIPCKRSWYE